LEVLHIKIRFCPNPPLPVAITLYFPDKLIVEKGPVKPQYIACSTKVLTVLLQLIKGSMNLPINVKGGRGLA